MNMRFAGFSIRMLALTLAAGCGLFAQLDPRLRMSTDTLDAFKKGSAKPEVIAVLDMSGSMLALSFDSKYTTNKDFNLNLKGYETATNGDMRRRMKTDDDSDNRIFLGNLTLPSGKKKTDTYAVYADNVKVKIVQMDDDDDEDEHGLAGTDVEGPLVAPDGRLVTPPSPTFNSEGKLDTSTWFLGSEKSTVNGRKTMILQPNIAYWVRQASHARLKFTHRNIGSRTVDVPYPWTLLPPPATAVKDVNDFPNFKRDPKSKRDVYFDTVDTSGDGVVVNPDYLCWIFTAKKDGRYLVEESASKSAWSNGLPVATRYQSIKRAFISTWLDVQDTVHLAYKYLDHKIENKTDKIRSHNTRSGENGSLRLMEPIPTYGDFPSALAHLQSLEASTSTPLTFALANAYAQMMDGSVFATARSAENSPFWDCRKHFVILFTDGQANDDKKGTSRTGSGNAIGSMDPYGTGDPKDGRGNPKLGAEALSSKAKLNPGSTGAFNIWTLAGVAAHGSKRTSEKPEITTTYFSSDRDCSPGSVEDTPEAFAPFGVRCRDTHTFTRPHQIQTMTVGVSLAGDVSDPGSSKYDMLLAAGYGDPDKTSWKKDDFKAQPIAVKDPTPKTPADTGKTAVRFYDAANDAALIAGLNALFNDIANVNTSTTAPAAPVVGLRMGNQLYFGTFLTSTSTPVWTGDLFMVGVKAATDGSISLQGAGGDALTGVKIGANDAIWAGSTLLKGLDWNARKLYTYFGSATSTSASENRYKAMDVDLTSSANAFSTANADLVAHMTGKPDSTDAEKATQKANIEWLRGKDRTDRMGDVINSSPVSIEYALSFASGIPALSSAAEKPGARFRLVFVGTNHGLLHAFGEVSYTEGGVLKASATELWSFVPKDFLQGLSTLTSATGSHLYLLDGSATGYLDEEQSTAGRLGLVDAVPSPTNTTIKDKALLVFGLGRGGRSHYALDVTNPSAPKLAWMLRPDDETGNFANQTIQQMGLASADPAIARVWDSTSKKFKDLIFLAGGLSTAEIDSEFGTTAKLGRSILALDILTGSIYNSWDFINDTALSASFPDLGSVSAGVVPFESLRRSFLTQRVYFTDRSGGVYALGSGKRQKVTATNPGFRIDNSDPKTWTSNGTTAGSSFVRKIYQAPAGGLVTTSPIPFTLPSYFQGAPASSGMSTPYAVGVTFGTGDRQDPMDRDYVNPAQDPPNSAGSGTNRLVVLFDRDDSAAKSYDSTGISSLAEISSSTTADVIDPSKDNYFLKTKDGYAITFKPGTGHKKTSSNASDIGGSLYFYEKIISEPLYLGGSLYYSLFIPGDSSEDSSRCGGGETDVFRIWDVTRPEVKTTFVTPNGNKSGQLFTFSGIAGRLAAMNPNTVAVAGNMTHKAGTTDVGESVKNAGGIIVGTDTKAIQGPKVRIRSWRIVR